MIVYFKHHPGDVNKARIGTSKSFSKEDLENPGSRKAVTVHQIQRDIMAVTREGTNRGLSPQEQPIKQSVCAADPERLAQWVNYLAGDIGPRPSGCPGKLKSVALHLHRGFADLGYQVELQPHYYRENTYYNVVAWPTGEEMAHGSHPLLVVGAHYDTVSKSPGADDNGSGVAGLMEMARLLAAAPRPGLRLVAFCPEEPPVFRTRNMGSYVYAQQLKQQRARLRGMICLEMIGYFQDDPGSQRYPFPGMKWLYPDTGNFIAMVGNLRSRKWTLQVKRAFVRGTDLPVEHLNGPSLVIGIDYSDHWSFSRFRYPAMMVTDTAFYRTPHYHGYSDLPATLDLVRTAKVVDGLVKAVQELA